MEMASYKITPDQTGWGVFHDGNTTGPYETKEAAFEATVAAASLALREGHAIEITAPGRRCSTSRRLTRRTRHTCAPRPTDLSSPNSRPRVTGSSGWRDRRSCRSRAARSTEWDKKERDARLGGQINPEFPTSSQRRSHSKAFSSRK